MNCRVATFVTTRDIEKFGHVPSKRFLTSSRRYKGSIEKLNFQLEYLQIVLAVLKMQLAKSNDPTNRPTGVLKGQTS
tara:strand:- start:84 stop:314 length:231 start_codon:yes stop_codon:yes gene_type:complete